VRLAHIAIETGGEAYFLGFGPLPSLVPFLSDIAGHIDHQYLVEFLAKPGEVEELREITMRSKLEGVELIAPSKVLVPGPALSLHSLSGHWTPASADLCTDIRSGGGYGSVGPGAPRLGKSPCFINRL
jgi:hypothetical protein